MTLGVSCAHGVHLSFWYSFTSWEAFGVIGIAAASSKIVLRHGLDAAESCRLSVSLSLPFFFAQFHFFGIGQDEPNILFFSLVPIQGCEGWQPLNAPILILIEFLNV